MFFKGDFNIKETWAKPQAQQQSPKPGSAKNQRKELSQPKSQQPCQQNQQQQQQQQLSEKMPLPSILNQAGKNVVEKDILSDELANRIVKNFKQEGGIADQYLAKKPPVNPSQPGLSPSLSQQQSGSNNGSNSKLKQQDQDLVSLMASKLSKAELLAHNQREEIKEKMKQIQCLQEELEMYKRSGGSSEQSKEQYEKLYNENITLKKQIVEMEKFLLEYGVKWVGSGSERKTEGNLEAERLKQELLEMKKPKYNYHLPKEIDINIILRRIEELNIIMEKEGCQEVYKDEKGYHKIRKMEPLPVGFYKNGIVLKGFPFYSYQSNDAQQILADILDGYFPYQLKRAYPEGTLLKVVDKTDEAFSADKNRNFGDIHSIEENALKPQSKEEFLDKLPKNVIKNGKIIPIRDEIAKIFDGGKPVTLEPSSKQNPNQMKHVVQPDGMIILQTEEQTKYDDKQLTPEEEKLICEIKVRTENAKKVIILKIFANKLIRNIYEMLKGFSETLKFEIVSNLTKQTIPIDCQQTLQELDLYPNAALNLKEIK